MTMTIKAGFGYWDLTRCAPGGDFRRAGDDGLLVTGVTACNCRPYGNLAGTSADGRRVLFDAASADVVEAARV